MLMNYIASKFLRFRRFIALKVMWENRAAERLKETSLYWNRASQKHRIDQKLGHDIERE